jgi:hypothetical protein
MHWRNHDRPNATIEPLPEGTEVFDEPQISFELDEQFIVFSARKAAEKPVHDPERRHAYVSVSPLTRLGAGRPHTTVVIGFAGSDILHLSEVKASRNPLEIEFAFQRPRISFAKHQAIRRVKKHLGAMKKLTLKTSTTESE